MARRRRSRRMGFNTKLITDVGLAGVGVKLLPQIINKFLPLDPSLWTVAGAGGTYLTGHFLKKPDMANAGIALGLVELVSPMIEDLLGGIGTTPGTIPAGQNAGVKMIPAGSQGIPVSTTTGGAEVSMADYWRLNDYVSNPGVKQSIATYRNSY